VLLVKKKSSSN